MKPDISYIARFDQDQKKLAIDQLRNFCMNTANFEFDSTLINDDCLISFAIKDEESTQWFKDRYDFANSVPGKTLIGQIQLWIKEIEEFCDFEFWAVASSVGQACLDSDELRNQLIHFVKNAKGQSLNLDHGDGRIETIFENTLKT